MSAIGPMPERLKRAGSISALGGAVLGVGVAPLLSEFLKPHAIDEQRLVPPGAEGLRPKATRRTPGFGVGS